MSVVKMTMLFRFPFIADIARLFSFYYRKLIGEKSFASTHKAILRKRPINEILKDDYFRYKTTLLG